MGPSKTELPSLRLALPIIDSIFKSIRNHPSKTDLRWSNITDKFSEAIPRTIKEAIDGRGQDTPSVTHRTAYDAFEHPDWVYENQAPMQWNQEQQNKFQEILAKLNQKQEVALKFENFTMRVDQVRFAKGQWILDGCTNSGIKSIPFNTLQPCTVESDSGIRLTFSPSSDQKPDANIYLTSGAQHTYILDYNESIESEITRLFATSPLDKSQHSHTCKPHWRSAAITVSFAFMRHDDSAWIEFVQNLTGLHGCVHLRGMTEIDSKVISSCRYLWFCTDSEITTI
jgi:hypothetical protein